MRYRKLIASRDPAAVRRIIEKKTRRGRRGDPLVAEVTAPKRVAAHEAEAGIDELQRLVAAGKLTETDLVYADDALGWRTLGEHPLTADWFVSEPVASTGQWVAVVAIALAVMALAMLLIR